jgi:hypothetical protein
MLKTLIIATVLLPKLAIAQQSQQLPQPKQPGRCPVGWMASGTYRVPGSDKAPAAIQKAVGVQPAGARAEVIASTEGTHARACARHGVIVERQQMTGLRAVIRKILLEREREEAIELLISRGPPAGSGISFDAWRTWHRYRFVACPASRGRHACSNHRCRMGAACHELWAVGLRGNRSALPRKERPVCGARNRQGKPCAVRVEPGKRRCRFHGGLSTGPKTPAGRTRIAEAQRRRWIAQRARQSTG